MCATINWGKTPQGGQRYDFSSPLGRWVERNWKLFEKSSWWQMGAENLKLFLQKRAAGKTLQVSSGQIGGRGPKETKDAISAKFCLGGLEKTENCLKSHPGGKC